MVLGTRILWKHILFKRVVPPAAGCPEAEPGTASGNSIKGCSGCLHTAIMPFVYDRKWSQYPFTPISSISSQHSHNRTHKMRAVGQPTLFHFLQFSSVTAAPGVKGRNITTYYKVNL